MTFLSFLWTSHLSFILVTKDQRISSWALRVPSPPLSRKLAKWHAVTTPSTSHSSATILFACTELPDSLEDAAIRAAEACAALYDATGPMSRCRVDFDTTVGDETFTLLKSSTEFMQIFVSALAKALIPATEKDEMDEQMKLAQARNELKKIEVAELDFNASELEPRKKHREELIDILQRRKKLNNNLWTGPRVRIYFPDEGNAALARRDWTPQVPSCVLFSSCGGMQQHSITEDQVILFFCPRASESDGVEEVLARHEQQSLYLKLTVFVNPYLVDMGVTGFGLAGRMLRERLIGPLQCTYCLRTMSWGALTRQWPNLYTIWLEDKCEVNGYRLIGTFDRLPSNMEVQDTYDSIIDNHPIRGKRDNSGPTALNQLTDFINGMMRL